MNIKHSDMISSQAEIILSEAKEMKGKGRTVRNASEVEYLYFMKNIDLLVRKFNKLTEKVNVFIKNEGLDEEIPKILEIDPKKKEIDKRVLYNVDRTLLELIFGAIQIVAFLKQGAVLPEITLNKLDSLSKELKELEGALDSETHANLILATDAFEKGSFLGSSLISGRVIRANFDKVGGENINEKITQLKNSGLVREKDGEETLLKANHFGRNLASHDLKIVPSSSEAISFLGDAIKISKIVSQYVGRDESEPKTNDNFV